MNMVAGKIVPSSSVVCADVNDEAVLLNVDTGIYSGLDGLGARIWRLVETGADAFEVFSTLLDDYDVGPEQLRADLGAFVADLQANGLIEAR